MTREALASALWEKALSGNVSAIEMLRKLGLLDCTGPSEGEQMLLALVERLLDMPELCEAERESFEPLDGGA